MTLSFPKAKDRRTLPGSLQPRSAPPTHHGLGRRSAARAVQAAAAILALLAATPLRAQLHQPVLSQAEIEQIRDARFVPTDCILLFVKFLDLRVQEIHDLCAKPRRPGREQDTHDLIEQFTAIADELADNLDDYGPRHADLRKALPKLTDATERWATALKSPPDHEAYNVSRKIALESVRDLREASTQLTAEQAAWFKSHPPNKQKDQPQNGPIDIPR
jgi:hypothetical protein